MRDWIRKFGTAFTEDEPRLLTDLDRQFAENFARARAQCQALVRGWMDLRCTAKCLGKPVKIPAADVKITCRVALGYEWVEPLVPLARRRPVR